MLSNELAACQNQSTVSVWWCHVELQASITAEWRKLPQHSFHAKTSGFPLLLLPCNQPNIFVLTQELDHRKSQGLF